MRKLEVWEDNGGGLTMFVWDAAGENIAWAHGGYEYSNGGQLKEDIQRFLDGEEPELDWDGNCYYTGMNSMPWDDIGGVEKRYKEISNTLGCELVADNDSIYPHKMGDAAAQAFGISLSGMKKAPETSIPTSIAVQMGKIFLAAPAETEAPEPEMSM